MNFKEVKKKRGKRSGVKRVVLARKWWNKSLNIGILLRSDIVIKIEKIIKDYVKVEKPNCFAESKRWLVSE